MFCSIIIFELIHYSVNRLFLQSNTIRNNVYSYYRYQKLCFQLSLLLEHHLQLSLLLETSFLIMTTVINHTIIKNTLQKTNTLPITVKNISNHTHIALWLSRMWYGCLARVRASLTYCFQIKFKLFFFITFRLHLNYVFFRT